MEHVVNNPDNPEAIRSEIDDTRERMDQTIDRLSERLRGRHLFDEVLGFFRPRAGNDNSELKEKISDRANAVLTSVTSTVKAHPVPTLLIGAGIAWLIYESRRHSRSDDAEAYEDELADAYDPDAADYEAASTYPTSAESYPGYQVETYGAPASASMYDETEEVEFGRTQNETGGLRGRAAAARQRLQQSAANLTGRSRELYQRGRQRATTAVQEHPVEVGLGLLALGVVAGLALPTHRKVNEMVRPRADQLKQQARDTGRDLVNRGKSVVQAAAAAAKEEAQNQGLTPDALREKAAAVASRAKEAATETARGEGQGTAPKNETVPPVSSPPAPMAT